MTSPIRQMDEADGSAEKKEKVQRDQSSKIAGSRGDRIASASSPHAFPQGIAERAEAQADSGKTLGRGMMSAARKAPDPDVAHAVILDFCSGICGES